ncbi:MAG: Lon protease [Candidatus Tectimicrobiota bacterium]|nr:MAG: Lon protease [Candidatus Tectomicrobia bacterium]
MAKEVIRARQSASRVPQKMGSQRRLRQLEAGLPLLPLRDVVVFPYMVAPLFVGREVSLRAVDRALSGDRRLVLVAQRQSAVEEPEPDDLYTVGTVAVILRSLKLPDGRVKLLVQGQSKVRICAFVQRRPHYSVRFEPLEDTPSHAASALETEALVQHTRQQLERLLAMGHLLPPDVLILADNFKTPGRLADLLSANLGLPVEEAQRLLETPDPVQRLRRVGELLSKELEMLFVQHKIQSEAREEISKTQREYFLREQLKAIQKELGEVDERTAELLELRQRLERSTLPPEVALECRKQLSRLERLHPEAAEASMVRTYLDWLLELPWLTVTPDCLDLHAARRVLDEDHYGLEAVKERILEYLGVRKLQRQKKGPILCFVGPPGVGKTSLGRSIARALGRKFVRLSLGGVRDEAEIRGHRRTYVGALPGRILQSMRLAGSANPVFMLDEVDKLGVDGRGDPAAALLEVLDPEQNHAFSDHYLGLPFDLSRVMFIATANLADTIPPTLRDRLEIIRLPGYSDEEKRHIARRYLLPRQLAEHGLEARFLHLSDAALRRIITAYTREAGLRNLERELATLCRKVARRVAEGDTRQFRIHSGNLHRYLGPPRYLPESEPPHDEVGVATGIAWTEAGGEIVRVEATVMEGSGQLTLTGHLGEVMKESAQAALSYTRANARRLGLAPERFQNLDIHLHVPAAAIPKDGPSAGITMATALISALTETPVARHVAMSGEITLRGHVLPVGGIKEKALAARRAGLTCLLLPQGNRKDLLELPAHLRRSLRFIFVTSMDEVLAVALRRAPQAAGA